MIDFTELRDRLLSSSYYAESIERGLTDSELDAVEHALRAAVPPDVREFLQTFLPIGASWPPWRGDPGGAAAQWQDEVLDAFSFDVEHNGYWLDRWGARPSEMSQATEVARADVATWPPLMRLYGHRCVPTDPSDYGNPVLSMAHPIDTIVYGVDLSDYFHHEFGVGRASDSGSADWNHRDARRVEPWFTAFRLFG